MNGQIKGVAGPGKLAFAGIMAPARQQSRNSVTRDRRPSARRLRKAGQFAQAPPDHEAIRHVLPPDSPVLATRRAAGPCELPSDTPDFPCNYRILKLAINSFSTTRLTMVATRLQTLA